MVKAVPWCVESAQGIISNDKSGIIGKLLVEHRDPCTIKGINGNPQTLTQCRRTSNVIRMPMSNQNTSQSTMLIANTHNSIQMDRTFVSGINDHYPRCARR